MTIRNTDVNDHDTHDSAVDTLLSRWTDAEAPSDTNKGGTSKDLDDEDEDEATALELLEEDEGDEDNSDADDSEDLDEDEDRSDEDDDDKTKKDLEAGDDHKVKITVDGETKSVTVKELKRLFGQEASLTRKSQEVALARKVAETDAERYMIAAQRMIGHAEKRFEPFAGIDWMVAQTKLTPEEFQALRTEARSAHEEVQFLRAEADTVLGQVQQTRQAAIREAAVEAIKVLETDVPGWNREVYDKVRTYAVSSGMDPEIVNGIVDPSAIKMLHKAMRYDELKSKASAKKTVAKGAPKRVVKSSSQTSSRLSNPNKDGDAMNRFRKSRSDDDAAAVLMSRWEKRDD
jgi:hypothetical protein